MAASSVACRRYYCRARVVSGSSSTAWLVESQASLSERMTAILRFAFPILSVISTDRMRVSFLKRLRGVERFDSAEAFQGAD